MIARKKRPYTRLPPEGDSFNGEGVDNHKTQASDLGDPGQRRD